MKKSEFLLYGANGYTGKLIATMSSEYGLTPILAGRKEIAIKPLAKNLNLPYRIIDLADTKRLEDAVFDVKVVLHAAGPFQYTALPMIEACLATGTNYLDITGEIPVFEMAKRLDKKARNAGIMIMPGVGFDVVPTDCLSLFLKKALPDATQLTIAFSSLKAAISHGTAITMVQNLGQAGAVRINGQIVAVPIGHKSMVVDFGVAKHFVMSIPWGDISTAFHTTGIPNIETYTRISQRLFRFLRFQKYFNPILRTKFVRGFIQQQINKKPPGPTDEERKNNKSLVWGQVKNPAGKTIEARLVGPDGYTLTVHSSLLITKKVLGGEAMPGYHTPAKAFGENLILEVPGVSREVI